MKKIQWYMCNYDLQVIDKAFGGSWEEQTQSKQKKPDKNGIFGRKKLRHIAPVNINNVKQ